MKYYVVHLLIYILSPFYLRVMQILDYMILQLYIERTEPSLNPRADGAKRRARVLIPPGYLHPGKREH
jgi:hypothetical protein